MELKEGYSSFKLLPENEEEPGHKNIEKTKNHLLLTLLNNFKENKKFADYVKNYKGNTYNFQKDIITYHYLKNFPSKIFIIQNNN